MIAKGTAVSNPDIWFQTLGSSHVKLMVLINLQKISGTKKYKIISQKMFSVRFLVHSVAWFDSYLSIEVFKIVSKVNSQC